MSDSPTPQTFQCPRRAEDGTLGAHPFKGVGTEDRWLDPTPARPHRVCSYCGSAHPDDVMVAMLNGALVTPTDKNYKGYIDFPHPDPEGQKLISVVDGPREGYVAVTAEQLKASGWSTDHRDPHGLWAKNGPVDHAKFYFHHFRPEHGQKLIDMLNAKAVKFHPPGHFYVLPFFIGTTPTEAKL